VGWRTASDDKDGSDERQTAGGELAEQTPKAGDRQREKSGHTAANGDGRTGTDGQVARSGKTDQRGPGPGAEEEICDDTYGDFSCSRKK